MKTACPSWVTFGRKGGDMRVAISTELAVFAERAWAEVQTSRLLLYVTSPILAFEPIGPLPFPSSMRTGNDGGERWSERASC